MSNNGWMPIETAPKDGSEVQLCFKGQFKWVIWIGRMCSFGLVPDGHAEPTHWQPLPAPPTGEDA